MVNHFLNNKFLKHQEYGFDQLPIIYSYLKKEENFSKTVCAITKYKVPSQANLIGSHTLCKVKQDENGSLICNIA